jgi:DNA-binding IclR family transcriptional regulator
VIELDRLIRENDPLIAAAREIMKTLSERTGGTVLLSRLHGRKVVCVHQVPGRHGPQAVSYERGRAMPLFRGATSKIILAHLPPEVLRDIVAGNAAELRRVGLPARFDLLSETVAAWRAGKVYATAGEVDAEAMGWAAAIHQGRHLLGSLSVVLSRRNAPADPARLADQVLRAALRIEGRLKPPGH